MFYLIAQQCTHSGVAWINTGMVDPSKVVTNRSTNWARCNLPYVCWCDQCV